MRIFLAVFPPPAFQALAYRATEALRRPGDDVSWVKRENLHYTMRFIGEVGEDGTRRVTEAAVEAAAGMPAFDAALGAPGAFPGPRRARVLWIGLAEGAEPLRELARRLEAALEKRGFERERQAFKAHLTLGRVRDPRADWTAALASVPTLDADPAARFRVDTLRVVQSQLSPKGSIYTVRHAAPLGG